MASSRRLAAIMFTDIVGYAAMMQESEERATLVREKHRNSLRRWHKKFHGEILQYYGDGTLSVFKSSVEAVECAIAIQRELQQGTYVPLRIGLHVGDIVFSGSEVYGDGVNLASRVENLGIPGAILISDKINYEIKNQENIQSQKIGYFEFKNIKEPVEIFAISNSGIKVPVRSELKGKMKEKKHTIAVLPFINVSSDPENEYFSDGISEEILNALVKIKDLRVTARTSSFSFKGKNIDVREIGQQLGVTHVLEGSVRKSDKRVRITAQFVSTVDGYHLFSQTYDRTLEDIFAVQDEISQKILNLLRQHLEVAQRYRQLVISPTTNMEAYETYLKGLYYFNQWGKEPMGKAIPYFQDAIEMQNDFALPHAQLGLCYLFQALGGKISWQNAYDKAIIHINRTKELNQEIPEGYMSLFTFNTFFQWDWQAAVETARKGFELFPNYAPIYVAFGALYYIEGDLSTALEAHRVGLQIDPLSVLMNLNMGTTLLWMGHYEQAVVYFNQVLEIIPNHRAAMEFKGWTAAFQGELEEALTIFRNLNPTIGHRLHRITCLGWIYSKLGKNEKAEQCLTTLIGLEKKARARASFAVDLAILYTRLNNFDLAFYHLEKAIQNKIGDSMMCKSDPWLAPLRSDSRFQHIKSLVGKVPAISFQ
ncbi:MAG: tetratricopeptide repeat protein [Saprospiraceae bacterium]|nr:tetratricopeptide repeat protein [Saprospiraceae bacterium]